MSEQAGGKAGKDSGKAKAKAVSRSARAGLQVSLVLAVERFRIRRTQFHRFYFSSACTYTIVLVGFEGIQVKSSWLARKTEVFLDN